MLALYHLFSGIAPTELAGIDAVMQKAGTKQLPPFGGMVLLAIKLLLAIRLRSRMVP